MSDAIIEAAARALKAHWLMVVGVGNDLPLDDWLGEAEAVLTAVTPLIRAAALEEAAGVAEEWLRPGEMKLRAGEMTAQEFRTAKAVAQAIHDGIRVLKEQP